MSAPGPSINQHLEGFMASVRQLESSLAEEKKKNQKIAQDYLATRTILENAVRDLQARVSEREKQVGLRDQKIKAVSNAYRSLQTDLARSKGETQSVEEREKAILAELNQFKTAWGEVLARENQARELILEHEKAKRIVAEQRIRLHGLESSLAEATQSSTAQSRSAEIYRRELESASSRLQASEVRVTQLQREGTQAIQKIRADCESLITEERRIARAASQETARLREESLEEFDRLRTKLKATTEENERLRNELKSAVALRAAESVTKTEEITTLRMHLLEAKRNEARFESHKKDASKIALMAALRHDQQVSGLEQRIRQLIQSGLYAEKVDQAPAGEKVYLATSVGMTRSSRRENASVQATNAAEKPI